MYGGFYFFENFAAYAQNAETSAQDNKNTDKEYYGRDREKENIVLILVCHNNASMILKTILCVCTAWSML